MIVQIQNAIAALNGLATIANGGGKIFELYVMTGIANVLSQNPNWQVTLLDATGAPFPAAPAPPSPYIQRGGAPSGMPVTAPALAQNPSGIGILNLNTGAAYELWNGIQFRGRSGGLHEFDVALVPAALAAGTRASTDGIPLGRPILAIECKHIQKPRTPDEMRCLIARVYDVSLLVNHPLIPPKVPPNAQIYPTQAAPNGFLGPHISYLASNNANKTVMATSTGFSAGALSMVMYYRISPYPAVAPFTAAGAAFFANIAAWIATSL